MGCTTGAKIFNDGREVIAFKNKDFQVESHSDTICLENPQVFGVRGVNLRIHKESGFSIGVNQYGLVALNSNVLANTNQPYDLLTERIIIEARTVDDAIRICKEDIGGTKKYQGGNMIIATPNQLAAIELESSEMAIVQSRDYLVRTNHHCLLNTKKTLLDCSPKTGQWKLENSMNRYKLTENILKNASSGKEIVSLLKSHHHEDPICRHGQNTIQNRSYKTIYSYLVTMKMEKTLQVFFDVVKGPPCEQSYKQFELQFPLSKEYQDQIRSEYPF